MGSNGKIGTFMNDLDSKLDAQTQQALEAAAFRTLVEHFQKRSDVQNIDLMNLAGFCRNCLSKWYAKAAAEQGIEIDYDMARERVYGIPYSEWKENHQLKATAEQLAEYKQKFPE